MHPTPPPTLDVRDLRYRYGMASAAAADEVLAGDAEPSSSTLEFGSFSARPGDVLLVRGGSGAGKSTLLHLLAGVLPLRRTDGNICVAGKQLANAGVPERDCLRPFLVGWMPQRLCLIDTLSIRENVLLPLALAGSIDGEAQERADALLAALAIAPLASRRPARISVGQAARASLARALVAKPRVLLADEPTAALDETSAALVAQQIAAFAADGGTAVVASHAADLPAMLLAAGLPAHSLQTLELSPCG